MSKNSLKTTVDHKSMNLSQLREAHSDMLATAADVSFEIPDHLQKEIEDEERGVVMCDELHGKLQKFVAGLDAERSPKSDKAPLAEETSEEHTESSKPKRAAKKASSTKGSKAPVKKTDSAPPAEVKEKKVAKKAAKKAPAKKAAKKAPAKKASAGSSKKFAEDAKITKLVEKNPCREGTGKFDRVAAILKHHGKTVGAFIKGGGKQGSLAHCVSKKWIKVG